MQSDTSIQVSGFGIRLRRFRAWRQTPTAPAGTEKNAMKSWYFPLSYAFGGVF
jgi:hypothetical protein